MQICPNCGQDNPVGFRFCGACAAPLQAAPAPETRKTVTIVFSDLAGSTALGERLDSEALREVMARYFSVFQTALERHGGVVEKFIGDAVMAVFGLPQAHEDDALRACRATLEMKQALAGLNDELDRIYGVRLANRTGVYTGEVVAGDPTSGQRLVTGDAVNTAARLEQAAPHGEVLIGEPTYRLVRDAVEVEPVEPVQAKGKTEPVPAFRLVAVQGREAIARRMEAPLVGREAELQSLLESFDHAASNRTPRLLTVLGDAGVGKSRLVSEFVSRIQGRGMVLRGRCLSYGEGITFWPLREVLGEAAAITDGDTLHEARTRIAGLLSGADQAELLSERLAAAIGLSAESFPVPETLWAVRKAFEHLAAEHPLVVVFDDIHWADATFLDLIAHVARLSRGPVVLCCAARHDLLEDRPEWSHDIDGALTLSLEPLSQEETLALASQVLGFAGLPDALEKKISASAGGNPLFIEQMLALWMSDGVLVPANNGWTLAADAGSLSVPPTISALLGARLDRLLSSEKSLLERASVVGQSFPRAAVEALSSEAERANVGAEILSVIRKQLVGPESASPAEEEAYRFLHALIRDAAYQGMLKRTRAELHERFATWVEQASGERLQEVEEIVGYHLEQAYLLLAELGPVDERGRELATQAGRRLASAGKRTFDREDSHGAANLLGRACALLPRSDPIRRRSMLDLAEALSNFRVKQEPITLLSEVISEAVDAADASAEWTARVLRARLQLENGESELGASLAVARQAIAVLETAQDDSGQSHAWRTLSWFEMDDGRLSAASEAAEHAIHHARRAGDRRAALRATEAFLWAQVRGVTPAPQILAECDRALREGASAPQHRASVLLMRLGALAMMGRFPEARSTFAEAEKIADELDLPGMRSFQERERGQTELFAGDGHRAASHFRLACDGMLSVGDEMGFASCASQLAEALLALGRSDEALELTRRSESLATSDDLDAQVRWRTVRARILASDGTFVEAEALAREAVRLMEGTELLQLDAEATESLARVLAAAGHTGEALVVGERALRLYERKGLVPRLVEMHDFLRKIQVG